ncbi:MAG TPA: hypothetical protein VNI20_08360 [Fimbriimonadaceae bacterium]|nr:hypothetical protein [Fimbriimonadaceae bacterium]
MKRFLIGTVLLASAVPALAEVSPITGSVHLTYSTIDVWRGINLVDDSVLKGTVQLKHDHFSGFIQGRMELTDTNSYPLRVDPTGSITALRAGIFYSFDYDQAVNVTVGAMAHQYPGVGTPQTQELYYAVGFGGLGNINVAVIQDIQAVKGYRVVATGSHTFPAGIRMPDGKDQGITFSAHVAYGDSKYNSFYYNTNSSTLTDLGIGASTDFNINQFIITPFLAYSALIDPDVLKGAPNRNNFYGGVSVGFKF